MIATLLTFFLYYIDENYYDFRRMKEWGNWIAFVFYVGVMYVMKQLLYKTLKNKATDSILGIILELVFL